MAWLAVVSLLSAVYEAYADYCGDNVFCHAPYKCCETKQGCCYDSMLHNSKHFRLQIWNMWYFWFLIIFMMMSCFGGCGYYRRRRLAMLTRGASPPPTRPNLVLGSQRRPRTRSQEGRSQHFNFFAYNGPGVNPAEPSTNLPPAYAEVISQPGLYPVNKVELPPYPGNDKPEDGQIMYGSAMVPPDCNTLPPPYSEHQYDPPVPPSSQSMPIPTLPSQRDSFSNHTSQGNPDQPPTVPADRANENIGQSNVTSSANSVFTSGNNTNSH